MFEKFVKSPALFNEEKLKTIDFSKEEGIKATIGKLKADPNGATVVLSYSFDEKRWTEDKALSWVKEHGENADWVLGKNEVIDFSEKGDEQMKDSTVFKMLDFVIKDFNDKERSFTAVASTESKDRDGDILRIDGWKLKNFKRNPVILWGHNASIPPIGKATDIWIEGKELKFTPKFMSAELNPFAEQVYQMFKQGFLRAFSVRFDPVKWEDIAIEKTPKPGERLRYGKDYKEQELLEISAVNIPANPEALKNAAFQDMIIKSFAVSNADTFADPALHDSLLKGEIEIAKKCCDCKSHASDKLKTEVKILDLPEVQGKIDSLTAQVAEMQKSITDLSVLKGDSKKTEDEIKKELDALEKELAEIKTSPEQKSLDELQAELDGIGK